MPYILSYVLLNVKTNKTASTRPHLTNFSFGLKRYYTTTSSLDCANSFMMLLGVGLGVCWNKTKNNPRRSVSQHQDTFLLLLLLLLLLLGWFVTFKNIDCFRWGERILFTLQIQYLNDQSFSDMWTRRTVRLLWYRIYIPNGRRSLCNGYVRRKWTGQPEFNSWSRRFASHIAQRPLG